MNNQSLENIDPLTGLAKKKSAWSASTIIGMPFALIGGILSGIWQGILSIFGIHPRAPERQHLNLDVADVGHELKLARDKADLATDVAALDGPAAVLAYAQAEGADRALVDISALSPEQTDWLLGQSDVTLAIIAMTGRRTAELSLKNRRLVMVGGPKSSRGHPEPETLPIPPQPLELPRSDWEIIRAGFADAVMGRHKEVPAYRPSKTS